MQTKLLEICRQEIRQTKDEKQKTKLSIIEQMLLMPDCFVHMSFDVALNVLIELGMNKDEAKNAYKKLASFSGFKEGQKWPT